MPVTTTTAPVTTTTGPPAQQPCPGVIINGSCIIEI
jgi:hypothetical protein